MARNFQPEIECSHANAHKEYISGQRTGEYVCESCGATWQSSASLESAQENYRRRLEHIVKQESDFEKISNLDESSLADKIEQIAHDKVANLVNEAYLSGLIGNTNATGWALDTLEVEKSSIVISNDEIICSADAQFAGDQDEDAGQADTIISGSIKIRIHSDSTIKIEDEEFQLDESSFADD